MADEVSEFSLAASSLGSFFHTECEKFLFLEGKKERLTLQARGTERDALASAVFEKGNIWEASLLELLKLQFPGNVFNGSQMTIDELFGLKPKGHTSRDDIFVYHFRCDLPDRFYSVERPKKFLRFRRFEVDFLRISLDEDGARVFEVIDAKSSKSLQLSHQVQIVFYVLALKSWCTELRISETNVRFSSQGVVWLPIKASHLTELKDFSQVQISTFPLNMIMPVVETYIQDTLPSILAKDPKTLDWHLNPLCQGCAFISHCNQEVHENGRHLSHIPNLSHSDFHFLKNLTSSTLDKPLVDIEDLVQATRFSGPMHPSKLTSASQAARVKRILKLSESQPPLISKHESPVLDAILSKTTRVIGQPCREISQSEDIGVYLAPLVDPKTGLLSAWSFIVVDGKNETVTSFSGTHFEFPEHHELLSAFVSTLSKELQRLQLERPLETTIQFFVFDESERRCLVEQIILYTCDVVERDAPQFLDAVTCFLMLVDSTDVLNGPELPDALSSYCVSGQQYDKEQLSSRLSALYKSHYGKLFESSSILKKALADKLAQLLSERQPSPDGIRPPVIASLVSAIRETVALPIPGYYTLESCLSALLQVSSKDVNFNLSDIYLSLISEFASDSPAETVTHVRAMLADRLRSLAHLARKLRFLIAEHCDSVSGDRIDYILFTKPRLLKKIYPLPVRDLNLRRLLYICEHEAVSSCEQIQESRRFSSEKISLQCMGYDRAAKGYRFKVLSGGSFLEEDPPYRFFGWLLSVDTSKSHPGRPLPHELFNDLAFFSQGEPQIPADLLETLSLSSVASVSQHQSDEGFDILLKCPYRENPPYLPFNNPDARFILCERFVDMNLSKISNFLFDLDFSNSDGKGKESLFQILLRDPSSWGRLPPEQDPSVKKKAENVRSMYAQVTSLLTPNDPLHKMKLKRSQAVIFQSILANRLQVVWGPPGTGKTHFLGLSILTLAAARCKVDPSCTFRVLVTAFTHSAIDNLLDRVSSLKAIADTLKHEEDAGWRQQISVHKVEKGASSFSKLFSQSRLVVIGATSWACLKSIKELRHQFDIVVIDEASQVPVSNAAGPVECVKVGGRLIISGDHLQLAPIIHASYPDPASGHPTLHRSFLECIIRGVHGNLDSFNIQNFPNHPLVGKLTENSRMNKALSVFSQKLYGKEYESQNPDSRLSFHSEKPFSAKSLLSGLKPLLLEGAQCLFTTKLEPQFSGKVPVLTCSYENQVLHEALQVSALAIDLLSFVDWSEFPLHFNKLFIVTPHRAQRAAITSLLSGRVGSFTLNATQGVSDIVVNTVEKMQGMEAAIVIVCFGYFDLDGISKEMDFIYNQNRLNVAVSRAKNLCFLVVTDAVLTSDMRVFETPARQSALAYLHAFVRESHVAHVSVDINTTPSL